MTDLHKEIKMLTEKWYAIVSLDYCKARECYWHIHEKWSCGNYPTYQIEHGNYTFEKVVDTHEKAQLELIKAIKMAIAEEREWALSVLNDSNNLSGFEIKNSNKIIEIAELEEDK